MTLGTKHRPADFLSHCEKKSAGGAMLVAAKGDAGAGLMLLIFGTLKVLPHVHLKHGRGGQQSKFRRYS